MAAARATPWAVDRTFNSLLGKILRLDVSGVPDGLPPDPLNPHYAVPADNPFVNQPGADEIFAYGLRNPWRDSFDRATGDFYIADVGQNVWEEIDIGQIGANYGWNVREGPDPYSGAAATGPVVDPISFYNHSVGHSITGGYVYRGEGEALQGQYFFADFVDNKIFTLRFDASSNLWVPTEQTAHITTDFGTINNPSSFGEDARGNLYIVKFDFFNDGAIFRLTPMGASADQGDVLRGLGGDDMLFGGSGNDTLEGGPGGDTLIGGPGIDTADYSSSPAGVSVNLQTGLGSGGDAQGDILTGIENLIGSPQADILIGDSGANKLEGRSGNDMLDGGPGMDTAVYGGTHSQYQITQNSNGSVHIVDLRGGVPDGVDDVSNVELFQFADGTINVVPVFELNAFGVNAGGWSSDDTYPRELADVDGDGRADIVGFGNAGVWVSLATAGGHFAAPTFELNAFGVNAGGWSSDDSYPRELADLNGDGRADIVGFGNAGVWVSLATAGGHFAAPTFELNAFGVNAGGWSSQDSYPRELADVNGDVRADIVGFGHAGVYVVSEFLVV
jgi:glucose/sorbosone dehydrogenase/hemolysin type calcium-binding protein/VCBS repeat protein